jgi:uncharacterized protein (TIGR03000 family)
MQKKWLTRTALAAVVAAGLLLLPATASAYWWGGWGGGWGGYYGGYRGWGGYSPWHYGSYSYPYYGGYSYPYYGGYSYPYYGSYSYPYYGSYAYYYPQFSAYPSSFTYPTLSYTFASPSTRGYYGTPASYNTQVNNTAQIDVDVPRANAVVTIDGQRMRQTGKHREFVTPPLTSGKRYHSTYTARWKENGQEMTSSKTVRFRAGDRVRVDLTKSAEGDNKGNENQKNEMPKAK